LFPDTESAPAPAASVRGGAISRTREYAAVRAPSAQQKSGNELAAFLFYT
jgi:hypothetical protein